jgi:hypothetical protein
MQAIKNRSLVYAFLSPGGLDPMTAAKKIKNEFVSKLAGDSDQKKLSVLQFVRSVSLDDFVRTLPTGQTKISNPGRERMDKRLVSAKELK